MVVNQGICRGKIRVILVSKLRVTKRHGLLKVLCINRRGHFFSLLYSLHERLSYNLVLVHGYEASLGLRSSFKNRVDGLHAL
jgi:hypothetical protein